VVGRGHQEYVKDLLPEQVPVVVIDPRRLLLRLPGRDHRGGLGQQRLVHVAERDDLDRRDLKQSDQVDLAVPAGADQAHSFRLLLGGARDMHARRRQRQAGAAGLEELATIHWFDPPPWWNWTR